MYSTGEERGSRFASLSSFAAMAQHQALLLLLCSLLLAPAPAWAVLPTSELIWGGEDLAQTNLLYAALAAFGPLTAPKDDALFVPLIAGGSACNLSMTMPIDPPFILVAERGNCTFDSKALAAQTAGASGIVVVNTLEGVYAGRDHGEPMDDYECENGEGWLAAPVSPSWNPTNDVPECSTDSRCESGVCMMTNVTDASLGTKVCCVWDTYINMGASKNGSADAVAIPSVFVTISEGSELLGSPLLEAGSLQGMLYDRPRPEFNASSFLLWGLGVATVGLAAWLSAGDLRRRRKRVKWGGHRQNGPEEESEKLTLTLQHTIGFVVVSSTMLMVLFFFELTTGVTVLFCLSALTSLSTIVTGPLVRKLLWNTMGNPEGRVWPVRFLEEITLAEVLSTFFSLIMVVWWVAVRQTADYAWLFQDLFGICLCIMFLDTLRIDSLKVATALLSLAFLYDIFWVFLSPYIFSESVMISVATGGGVKADPTYCEKYPSDADCQQFILPMLLLIPRINDYQLGDVMLGLGDIVLPGLLLSFAVRYDTAMNLKLTRGFFLYIMIGYACGLFMANVAVVVFNFGQPALLYLVPCTLVPFTFISVMDKKLPEMWAGPACLSDGHPQGYLPTGVADDDGDAWPHDTRQSMSSPVLRNQEIVTV